jgi:hypothetical protein
LKDGVLMLAKLVQVLYDAVVLQLMLAKLVQVLYDAVVLQLMLS